jgi:hypothetical protein
MKNTKLPLPLLILILATLFSLASTFGGWIGRPSSALRTPPRETVEQQQAAIVYVRVISWLSRLITHPAAHPENHGATTARARGTSARTPHWPPPAP